MYKKTLLYISLCILTACNLGVGNEELPEGNVSSNQIVDSEGESSILTSTTTTTQTTTTTIYKCSPDNNTNVDFNEIKNVQIFLNKYGYNAGKEDGYLGNQTVAAIKDFQTFSGLKPDGDVGPATRNKMKEWTGCEEKAPLYVELEDNTSTTSSSSDSSATTTTTTTTTTTVPGTNTISKNENEFGYLPSVSIKTNNVLSVFKGIKDTSSICGTPYLNNLETGSVNLYENGNLDYSYIGNKIFTESTSTAEIVDNTVGDFAISIMGNGDTNFRYYFIKPYGSDLVELIPKNITSAPGLTTAIFDKTSLEQGYWFFSFAENNSGQIVKSGGLREVLVSSETTQTQDTNNEIDTIFFLKDNKNITKGLNLNNANELKLFYTTKNLYDTRDNTTNLILESANNITLKNDTQASSGQIIYIGRELMLVNSKNGNEYSIERGYLGTQQQEHPVGSSVRVIQNTSKESLQSSFAYAVIRSELGFRYQVALGSELKVNKLSTDNCPNGLYSFEEITIFSWRPKGSSVVYTSTKLDLNNPIFDKQFLINNSYNYEPPTLSGTEPSGNFINKGPKNIDVTTGDKLIFNFQGIDFVGSEPKFVELKFKMNPYSSSEKLSSSKALFFDTSDGFLFEINVKNISTSSSFLHDTWESGYKYIFDSITVYDGVSKTTFKNNQEVIYDYKTSKGSHAAYYLDQFIFNIP